MSLDLYQIFVSALYIGSTCIKFHQILYMRPRLGLPPVIFRKLTFISGSIKKVINIHTFAGFVCFHLLKLQNTCTYQEVKKLCGMEKMSKSFY